MIIDTNLVIDLLAGNNKAKEFLINQKNLNTCSIIYMETIQGIKRKDQINKIEKLLNSTFINIYQINESISKNAYKIIKGYFHKQHIGIADALIASTAMYYNEAVITLNLKHFKNIKGLKVEKPY